MFDAYRIDILLTSDYDDAGRRLLIDNTEVRNRAQARRDVMTAVSRFAPWLESATTHNYWAGYATAMFDCTDPNQAMFLDAREGGRELSIAIRPI